MEDQLIKFNFEIVDFKGLSLFITILNGEFLQIKQHLLEFGQTCFYTSYHLQMHNNYILDEGISFLDNLNKYKKQCEFYGHEFDENCKKQIGILNNQNSSDKEKEPKPVDNELSIKLFMKFTKFNSQGALEHLQNFIGNTIYPPAIYNLEAFQKKQEEIANLKIPDNISHQTKLKINELFRPKDFFQQQLKIGDFFENIHQYDDNIITEIGIIDNLQSERELQGEFVFFQITLKNFKEIKNDKIIFNKGLSDTQFIVCDGNGFQLNSSKFVTDLSTVTDISKLIKVNQNLIYYDSTKISNRFNNLSELLSISNKNFSTQVDSLVKGDLMFNSKYSHSNQKLNHLNISQMPTSSKVHHIYLDPSQFASSSGWLDHDHLPDLLQQVKNHMGNVRHTPFNEEIQTIFETENLSILEGTMAPVNVKDKEKIEPEKTTELSSEKEKEAEKEREKEKLEEQSRDKFARVKMHIRSMHEFQEEARKAAVRMVQGKIPYLNPADCQECFIAIENGMFLSMCNQEERQLKFGGMSSEAQFRMLHNWDKEDVDSEHPTRKQVKNELNNLSIVYNYAAEVLRANKLRLVFATIVDYMGKRVYVQAIMPSLIYQVSNQEKANIQGSVDEFQTIKVDESFKKDLEAVLDKLLLKQPTYIKNKTTSEELVFNGPLEFKGSLTEDGKRQLVDLIFLTPKDSKFESYYHKYSSYSIKFYHNQLEKVKNELSPQISKVIKDIIKANFKEKQNNLMLIENAEERAEKQKELTASSKKTSETVDNFIKSYLMDQIQLKIDPNFGYKQLNDWEIKFEPKNITPLENFMNKLKSLEKFKTNELINLIDSNVLLKIKELIPTDEVLQKEMESYCNDQMVDQIIIILKAHTLNKVGNIAEFTTDKAVFTHDILKAILHEFGLNCRHLGAIANRLQHLHSNPNHLTELNTKFGDASLYSPLQYNDFMHIQNYIIKEMLTRSLKHTLNLVMSDQGGSNLKNKLIKVLNIFLSLSESFSKKEEELETSNNKKKRKKKLKVAEREMQDKIMRSSFNSSNSECSDRSKVSNALQVSTKHELWDQFTLFCDMAQNQELKDVQEYSFLSENICLLSIIRRACMMAGVTLKLMTAYTSDNLSFNLRIKTNFKLSVDNISMVGTRLKTMKCEPKDLMNAMQEAQDCVYLSYDQNRKMYGIKIMLNLIEEARQIFGTQSERYLEFLNMLAKMYASQQLGMQAESVFIYRQAIDIFTKIQGPDHYQCLNVILELSYSYQCLKDMKNFASNQERYLKLLWINVGGFTQDWWKKFILYIDIIMQEMTDGKDNASYDWVEEQLTWVINSFDSTIHYEKIILYAKFLQLINNIADKNKTKFSSVLDSFNSDATKFCGDNKNLGEALKKVAKEFSDNKADPKAKRKILLLIFDDKETTLQNNIQWIKYMQEMNKENDLKEIYKNMFNNNKTVKGN